MEHAPLISIIMPAHNAGRYIARAVESVIEQTWPHWELIIVDDASTDDTADVVARYRYDARIRYHRAERIGHPAGVRNMALRMAEGDLIAFLDADDEYFPRTLEKLSRPLRENSRLSAVYGFAFHIDEHGLPLRPAVSLVPLPETLPDGGPDGGNLYELPGGYSHSWGNIATSNISCLLPALMLRRSAWERIGFFNEALCGPEDYEFYIRMYLDDYEGVHCLADYVYCYRVHAASLTKAPEHYERLLCSGLIIQDWLFQEAPIPDTVRRYKSRAYVGVYRYFARERLLHRQPELAREIACRAMTNPNVRWFDFMTGCLPIVLRSWLPGGLDARLVDLKWRLWRMKSMLSAQRQWSGTPS